MKNFSLSILVTAGALGIATLNTSCLKADAASTAMQEPAPQNGAKFKKGEGVSLSDEMKATLNLQVADVTEEKVGSSVTLNLHSAKPNEASGWLAPQQAALLKPGAEVDLVSEGSGASFKGSVQRVEKAMPGAMGDYEVTIQPATPFAVGSRIKATVHAPAGDPVAAVPRSALLKTAEGCFVFAVNGAFYVRTPVKVGAMSDTLVEITDGLYSGDQIVTSPVMSLWMTELQVLRGGKACTCGH